MIRSAPIVLLLGSLVIPGQVMAQDEIPSPPEVSRSSDSRIVVEGERDKKKTKECTRSTATGSIMTKMVCKTVEQIETEQAQAVRAIEKLQDAQETMQQTAIQQGDVQAK